MCFPKSDPLADVLKRRDLTAGSKLIFAALYRRFGKKGYCRQPIRVLADDIGYSKRAAKMAITDLRAKRIIRRCGRTDIGAYMYTIDEWEDIGDGAFRFGPVTY